MVILWFAGAALVLVILLWVLGYVELLTRGDRVEVDNDRDINDRFFADVLRGLLKPALAPDWGQPEEGASAWRFGQIHMRRRDELVGVYLGRLELGAIPRTVAALVVSGDLAIADDTRLDCDIWCTGSVTVGARCRLRGLAADGSIRVGEGTLFQRWVDTGADLELGPGVSVVAQASAVGSITMYAGFAGGKVTAPLIRIIHEGTAHLPDRTVLVALADRWDGVRTGRDDLSGDPAVRQDQQWTQTESITALGPYWAGPRTVVLHDLVLRDRAYIGDACVVAGSIHAEKELVIGRGALVTGNVACGHLTLEPGAAVGGSVHADGDAILHDGAVVGLTPESGGLVATGCVQLLGHVEIARRITAGDRLAS